jgi:hypothetical protein
MTHIRIVANIAAVFRYLAPTAWHPDGYKQKKRPGLKTSPGPQGCGVT